MISRFTEKRSTRGTVYYLVTRGDLERAPGFRSAGGTKARAACLFHGGDNPQALEIDFAAGEVRCFTRGCYARIVDSVESYGSPERAPTVTRLKPAKRTARRAAPKPENLTKPNIAPPSDDLGAKLAASCERAQAALPDSPAAAYLARRGIPLELAARYGLGWSTAGTLRDRLIFPLTAPDGTITSATGRTLSDTTNPKYLNLSTRSGYEKGWFNALAIARARETGAPVYLCEGGFDCLALLAGGIDTATAILGKRDPRLSTWLAQWITGIPGVVFCPDEDSDGAGRDAYEHAARSLVLTVSRVAVAPRGYLGTCKDLGEFWEAHHTIPPALATITFAPRTPQNAQRAPQGDESPALDLRPPLTPELEALVKPEWFIAPVPVHLLTQAECAALSRYSLRTGARYEVVPTPPERMPPPLIPS